MQSIEAFWPPSRRPHAAGQGQPVGLTPCPASCSGQQVWRPVGQAFDDILVGLIERLARQLVRVRDVAIFTPFAKLMHTTAKLWEILEDPVPMSLVQHQHQVRRRQQCGIQLPAAVLATCVPCPSASRPVRLPSSV